MAYSWLSLSRYLKCLYHKVLSCISQSEFVESFDEGRVFFNFESFYLKLLGPVVKANDIVS